MSPYLSVHLTAEQQLKNDYPKMFRMGLIWALVLHALAFLFLPEFKPEPYRLREKPVVEAIDIQYEVGGDLAEVLDNVAETIRDRDQIRRQVRALSAEGRMSAVILVLMPFALALAMSMVSPDYLAELTGTTIGRIMIGGALVMIGVGAVWIRRIVKVVF